MGWPVFWERYEFRPPWGVTHVGGHWAENEGMLEWSGAQPGSAMASSFHQRSAF
jgi:hypothetical protein